MIRRGIQVGLALFLVGGMVFLTLTLLERQTQAQAGSILYVAPGGDCGGMIPCYDHPQDAVDAAEDGDIIKVAAGSYTGVDVRPRNDITTTGVVTQVVYISKTLTLRGGYAVIDWDNSDPENNATTMDARGQGRGLYITGAITPTVEGLYITGGNATGLGSPMGGRNDGGGGACVFRSLVTISSCVFCSNTASTTSIGLGGALCLRGDEDSGGAILSNNTFQENIASTAEYGGGGGLYLSEGEAKLSNNTFRSNIASVADDGTGGGVYLTYSDATLNGNIVIGNTASKISKGRGGGLCLWSARKWYDGAILSNNIFQDNVASGADHGYGGGLYLTGSNLDVVTLNKNDFRSNIASKDDWGYGGGMYLQELGNAILNGNVFQGNIASMSPDSTDCGHGGGVYGSSVTLNANVFVSNTASTASNGYGGGLYLGNATLRGNIVRENAAGSRTYGSPTFCGGGGLFVLGRVTLQRNMVINNTIGRGCSGSGGGLCVSGLVTLTNNIVAGNSAAQGSGLSFGDYAVGIGILRHNTVADNPHAEGIYVWGGTVTCTNTILSGHTTGITVREGATAALLSTLWHGNGANTWGPGSIVTGTLNVYDDPAFVNAATLDYHISPGSAAIDRGVEAGVRTDIDNEPRPYQTPDLGADEYWPAGALKCVYLPMMVKDHP